MVLRVLYLLAFLITSIGRINVFAELLKVHPANPRYFADKSGKAVYLGGHQIFVDLQDNSFNKEFITMAHSSLRTRKMLTGSGCAITLDIL